MIRLYPIYLIAIGITIFFFPQPIKSVIGHLFFLQIAVVDFFKENVALWSLNYEMLYYLLAIPIIMFRIKALHVISVILLILIASGFKFHLPTLIESYLSGFIFWLSGYWLSGFKISEPDRHTNKLLAALLLLLSVDYINGFNVLLSKLHINNLNAFADLSVYPYCLFVLLIFSGCNKPKLSKILYGFVYLSSLGQLLFIIYRSGLNASGIYLMPSIFICLSFLFWYIKMDIKLTLLSFIGGISYALYALHFPILYLIGTYKNNSGSLGSFVIRLALLLIIVFSISWVLEKKLQPRIKILFKC